jgi:excisionase family DNA binding protein
MNVIYCAQCRQQTELVTIKQACAITNKTRGTIYNWIHAGQLHPYRSPSGGLLICKASLVVSDIEQPQQTG